MHTRSVSGAAAILVIAWAVFAVAACAQPASRAGAAFPMLGIASGQSIRINALNLGSRTSTTTSSCNVTIRFLDAQGAPLKEATVNLIAGKGTSLDLTHEQTGSSARIELRAVLLFGYTGGAPLGPDAREQFDCNIIPSVEVYDNATGRTSLILTDWKPVPGPDPRSIGATRPSFTEPNRSRNQAL